MMLAGALELAGLVRDQQPLFWRDECLTQYTRNMKEMVLKLEGQVRVVVKLFFDKRLLLIKKKPLHAFSRIAV